MLKPFWENLIHCSLQALLLQYQYFNIRWIEQHDKNDSTSECGKNVTQLLEAMRSESNNWKDKQ